MLLHSWARNHSELHFAQTLLHMRNKITSVTIFLISSTINFLSCQVALFVQYSFWTHAVQVLDWKLALGSTILCFAANSLVWPLVSSKIQFCLGLLISKTAVINRCCVLFSYISRYIDPIINNLLIINPNVQLLLQEVSWVTQCSPYYNHIGTFAHISFKGQKYLQRCFQVSSKPDICAFHEIVG